MNTKPHKTLINKKRTPTFLANLNRTIKANPAKNLTTLAKKKKVCRMTIQRLMVELGLKSYRLMVRHLLMAKMKEMRVVRGKRLLSKLKGCHSGHRIIFFDEKVFTLDRSRNSQNDRYIARIRDHVPHVSCTKNPASIMVYGAVASDGKKMRPHFFKHKEKVNTAISVNLLKQKVILWKKRNIQKPYVYQQDSAPCHVSYASKIFLEKKMDAFGGPNIWPSNLPNLNPMDYFF